MPDNPGDFRFRGIYGRSRQELVNDPRGRGDGLHRNSRGMEDRLGNGRVNISRAGDVAVSFNTDENSRLSLRGRITQVERDRLYADMSGNGIAGAMMIMLEGRTRVRDISMSGSGRMRYKLHWSNQKNRKNRGQPACFLVFDISENRKHAGCPRFLLTSLGWVIDIISRGGRFCIRYRS
jgi:hypothetical protein